MESRYIKVTRDKAVGLRKEILNSQLTSIYALKKMRMYDVLRKKELVLKSQLKSKLSAFKIQINSIISTFPEYVEAKPEVIKTSKIEKKVKEPKEFDDLKKDLDEIKKKLARLQ
ncbi:hypothetical protein J4221_04840 [Candidatus Pacearchaeota archaeon]|nr:hypothetical protein [Candidatus Pacearchaeota archaeon]